MPDQLPMTPILDAADVDYHAHCAVKPSWFAPCSTEDCDISAWVDEETEEPFCCMLCDLGRKGKPCKSMQ